jgi:hypothetical protein
MTIGHWTAAVLVASLLTGCDTGRDQTDAAGGTGGGMTSGATPTDTTMTGGQGGMADTSMGGMHDTMRAGAGADTSRP